MYDDSGNMAMPKKILSQRIHNINRLTVAAVVLVVVLINSDRVRVVNESAKQSFRNIWVDEVSPTMTHPDLVVKRSLQPSGMLARR